MICLMQVRLRHGAALIRALSGHRHAERPQLREEAAVLVHGADAHADPFGEAVGGHVADDDALFHERLEDRLAAADADDEAALAELLAAAPGARAAAEIEAAALDAESALATGADAAAEARDALEALEAAGPRPVRVA